MFKHIALASFLVMSQAAHGADNTIPVAAPTAVEYKSVNAQRIEWLKSQKIAIEKEYFQLHVEKKYEHNIFNLINKDSHTEKLKELTNRHNSAHDQLKKIRAKK